jgi:organic radical activating enzyme
LGDGPEIFHTIRGEGASAGGPAVFIRASGCNLHCVWCDTDYTWNFEGTPWPHEKDTNPGYAKFQPAEVAMEIHPTEAARLILAYGCPRTVITGGEPLLQQPDFLEMIRLIRAEQPAAIFEVETNGTRLPSPEFAAAIDQFNVSPKLSNAAMTAGLRLRPDVVRYFAASPKAWFKFVVANPDDLAEVQELLAHYAIPADRTLLMPEGRNAAELDRSAPWLADACRDLGLRFCDRLHIRIWGERRGV